MKPLLVLCTLLLLLQAEAQQFGAFPPATRWKAIRTDTLNLLFTPGAEAQAASVATLIHQMARENPAALGGRLRSIDMVLHSRTTLANGYVGLAPYRSEFYLVPPSDPFQFGNLPWAQTLAVHEYRHVQQFNAFRSGGSRLLYLLFGEGGLALAGGLTVPEWFWEGDAVVAETALTTGGRGRLPSFWNSYRSLWSAGRDYSWMKLRNGSLKDYVPNHYPLGFALVNYGYLRYGDGFWKGVTQRSTSFRHPLYPFQTSFRREAGISFRQFRKEALDYYRKQTPVPQKDSMPRRTVVADVHYPQPGGRDTLVYLRSAYNEPAAFYRRTAGGEARIRLKSIGSDEWFSYRRGTIAYTTYRVHPRYTLIDYSDVVLLDAESGKERRLTRKGRYFAPDLSQGADRILAVSVNDSLGTDLHLLDATDGRVLSVFRGNENYFAHPRWVGDTAAVLTVRNREGLNALHLLHLASGSLKPVTGWSRTPLGMPYVLGDTVLFTGRYGGNDEVQALRLSTGGRFVITSGVTGAYGASATPDSLWFTRFTAAGQRLVALPLQGAAWKGADEGIDSAAALYPLGYTGTNLQALPDRRFAVRRYRQGSALFRFHSWTPDYTDPEFSLRVNSDNTLNNFSNQLYYAYNRNETSHTVGASTTWGGWFPLLSAGVQVTRGRDFRFGTGTVSLASREAYFGYTVPLVLTGSRAFRALSFGSRFTYNETSVTGLQRDSFRTSAFRYLTHSFGASVSRPRAVQEILPALSAAIAVQHRHALGDERYQFWSGASATLPGPGNTVFQVGAAVQDRDIRGRLFADLFTPARGYDRVNLPRMWRLSGNYHFPIAYPDRGAFDLVYVRRVRGNLFFDYSRLYGDDKRRGFPARSTGMEVFFDTRWLNTLPLTIGVRGSQLLDARGKGFAIEFALPLDLIPDL